MVKNYLRQKEGARLFARMQHCVVGADRQPFTLLCPDSSKVYKYKLYAQADFLCAPILLGQTDSEVAVRCESGRRDPCHRGKVIRVVA